MHNIHFNFNPDEPKFKRSKRFSWLLEGEYVPFARVYPNSIKSIYKVLKPYELTQSSKNIQDLMVRIIEATLYSDWYYGIIPSISHQSIVICDFQGEYQEEYNDDIYLLAKRSNR